MIALSLFILLGLILLSLVVYIFYKHKENKFDETATTDDGDNEFDQLEETNRELEELINRKNL